MGFEHISAPLMRVLEQAAKQHEATMPKIESVPIKVFEDVKKDRDKWHQEAMRRGRECKRIEELLTQERRQRALDQQRSARRSFA